MHTLATASDQFIVRRGKKGTAAISVIAGYPWFADWGRDTMIALPGLTTTLARYDTAAALLRSWAGFVDRGMLPNCFPDRGAGPEYNSADAALWLFHALEDYLAAHRDPKLMRELYPTLMGIIRAHLKGTRFGIQVDPSDGLLRAGEPGVQVTWMDAKHGDHVFTPRIGKPVEINALWLNALHVAARLAGRMRSAADQRQCRDPARARRLELRPLLGCGSRLPVRRHRRGRQLGRRIGACAPTRSSRCRCPTARCSAPQMRAVVEACARELLASYGLRSLAPKDPAYRGQYTGDPWQRDAAYHQGTVWSWLLGPFARAHYRVYGDARRAQSFSPPSHST